LSTQQQHPGPLHVYRQDIASGVISFDAAQEAAIAALEQRHQALVAEWCAPPTLRQRIVGLLGGGRHARIRKGLYLWGGVGRGKTFLMDLFFHALPGERKLRMHFHRFMQMVHRRLREEQGRSDPLEFVARGLAVDADVLCFDEFFVSDIGDAMILGNLLEALFRQGVMLVATSNIEPARLYERGLQRQRFLPAIGLLQQHTDVMNVDGGTDYRLRSMDRASVYLSPADAASQSALGALFAELTRGMHVESPKALEIEGRSLVAKSWAEGIAWFDFATLCRGARGAADYIELARQFHTVFVQDLPCLQPQADDEARRFITMVDEFYDRGVKLVLSAACGLESLYCGEQLKFAFERTASRLLEMQTRTYLAAPHRPD
jgi:cell division protein ZapE